MLDQQDALKNKLKNSIEDVELTEDDRSYITEEAKIAALLYHALLGYGIPGNLAESLTRDYFNSRLGCEEDEEETTPTYQPGDSPVRAWWFYP